MTDKIAAETERVVKAPPCWWIDHGSYGQITQRQDEAERAVAEGKMVVEYARRFVLTESVPPTRALGASGWVEAAAKTICDTIFGAGHADGSYFYNESKYAAEKLAALTAAPAPADVAEILRKLEAACDNAAVKRSQATYDQMISDPGAEDALDELDIARREARAFLDPTLYGRI